MVIVWATLVLATIASLTYSAIITWGFGRRRPGATAITSAVYMFLITLFATWAIIAWVGTRGPLAWDAPWLMIVIVGAVIALVVVTTATERRAERGELPAVDSRDPVPSIAAGLGFGSLFWLMIVALLIATLIGVSGR